jgi:hypothetical protein
VTDIAQRIADYPSLPPDERAEVEAYVARHPEWQEEMDEALALAQVLDALPGDEMSLEAFVVDEAMGLDSPAMLRMRERLASDAALAREAEALRAHLHLLTGGMAPPAEQFERLTGRPLDPPPSPDAVPRGIRTAAPRAVDRTAAAPPRRARTLRRATVLLGALALVYTGLFAASASLTPDRTRVAGLDELTALPEQVVRGPSDDALQQRLGQAFVAASAARHTTLGLFPRYDNEVLDVVADSLVAISAAAQPESAVAQEARLALGRIRVQQGRDAEAARILGALVREGNYPASTARRVLDGLR